MAVCHFYGWALHDVRAMTLRDYLGAINFLVDYKEAEAKSYNS